MCLLCIEIALNRITIKEAKNASTEIITFKENPTEHNKKLHEALMREDKDEILKLLEDE